MIRIAGCAAPAAALALAFVGGAWGQVDAPGSTLTDELEGKIIHWIGPQTIALQKVATEEYYASHTRDLVMPFGPLQTHDCRMPRGVLVIRRDGAGEFRATTLTLAGGAEATWHTDIRLLDAKGRALFDTGDFAGSKMTNGKPRSPYVWVNKFTMDRATLLKVYDDIDHASLSYVC